MNREAVALGTPVFTTFEGRLGAVDEQLIRDGRLTQLTSPDQIVLAKRPAGGPSARTRRDPRLITQLLLRPAIAGSSRPASAARRASAPIIEQMRRRLRSATFPLHRHSLPQFAVDAGLVALAYYLAFLLRLDSLGGAHYKYGDLFERTPPWVVLGSALLLAVGRVYQRRWRYTTQRDIEHLLRLLLIDTVAIVAAVAIVRPYGTVRIPDGTIVLYFLLALLFGGARLATRSVHDRRLRGFRARKDTRTVLIVGAGDGGRLVLREMLSNTALGLRPVGFVDDDPKSGAFA